MRIGSRHATPPEVDYTPMIDMTFQLIAFFMFVLNFSDAEQNERIQLPASALAIPPERPLEKPLTLQLTKEGTVLFAGDEVSIAGLKDFLVRERQVLEALGGHAADSTIIIRADANAQSGKVQELIDVCQKTQFERFSLRAQNEESSAP